jgi:parallel beta-helix repeat protein
MQQKASFVVKKDTLVKQIYTFVILKIFMKITLSLVFLALSSLAAATDYYVKNGGNDQNTGTSDDSAWATINKVNSVFPSLLPGDRILFKRGSTFYGTILISKSGSAGNPIILSAYGTGEMPIITGLTVISSWSDEGSGIYSAFVSSQSLTNMVIIDGKQYPMGRWPDNAYNIYESCSTNTSISDSDLTSDINWKGAEAVIRKNDWTLDRCRITEHTGTSISYISLGTNQDAIAKHGYFIQNDLRTLTSFGEWYHDHTNNKIYVYFGTINPTLSKVEVATLDNLVCNDGMDYINFENLNLKGSASSLIQCDNSLNDYITVQNCHLSFAGLDGIKLWGHYGIIANNLISSCNQTGIKIIGNQHKITSNVIEKIGLLEGQAMSGNLTNGIVINDNDCLVRNNIIRYIGYCGISLSSTADVITIQNNYIHNVLLKLNDGGGIYVAREGILRTFDANIITDVIGNTSGTPYPTRHIARGIYLDVNSTNVIVTNNTVANCVEAGFMIHRAHDNKIENNTAFNNGYGMYFQNSLGSNIRNNSLRNNIFIAKDTEQLSLKFSTVADDILLFGNADYNYYARPGKDDDAFHTYSPSTGSKYRTLADWQSFTGQDRNSKKSAVTVSDTSKMTSTTIRQHQTRLSLFTTND